MKNKLMVLFGGKSVEHDISIITAMQAMKNLPKAYDFLPIFVDKKGIWWTAENLQDSKIYSNFQKLAKNKKRVSFVLGENVLLVEKKGKFVQFAKIEQVLNCCHGNNGEDGAVQGLFKICEVAQTSSNVTSSALCMDKVFMKNILEANQIPSPEYICVYRQDFEKESEKTLKNITNKIKFPVIVKPANLGSSIGISVCKDKKELNDALLLAFSFDRKVLVEKLVENLKEFNCACFKFKDYFFVSSVNEVTNKGQIYSFEDKYLSENSKSHEADKKLSKEIKTLTEKVYQKFDCQGVVRVDFLFDDEKKLLYVNEINSIPGSLAFYLFKDIPFKDLLSSILQQAQDDFAENQKLVKTFDSNALEIFNSAMQNLKK